MLYVLYDEWVDWIEVVFLEKGWVFDFVCGIGEIFVRFVEKGCEVMGIDLSEDMLSCVQQKKMGKLILFFQQDMREFFGFEEQFDVVVICCDFLNYLKMKNDVFSIFKSVFCVLKEGGLLLFDVYFLYKMMEFFLDSIYVD